MLTALRVRAAATRRSVWRRQECRNLDDVGDAGDPLGLRGFVNVGEDRETGARLHLGQRAEARLQAGTAERRARCAIGFVERGLEDEGNVAGCGNPLERQRKIDGVCRALDDARSRHEGNRIAAAHGK